MLAIKSLSSSLILHLDAGVEVQGFQMANSSTSPNVQIDHQNHQDLLESNEGYFFQTDKSIAFHQAQETRSKNTSGNPIKLASKIICGCILNSELALLGLANGTIQLIDLVNWKNMGKISDKSSGPVCSLAFSSKLG